MSSDLAIIIVGAAVILMALFVWFWNHTVRQVHGLKALEKELAKIWEDRRDIIPFLVESYRGVVQSPSGVVQEIIDKRAEARNAKKFATLWRKEQELEDLLFKLFSEGRKNDTLKKDIGWLEARTEIESMNDPIEKNERRYEELQKYLRGKSQQPPYMIFGGYIKRNL